MEITDIPANMLVSCDETLHCDFAIMMLQSAAETGEGSGDESGEGSGEESGEGSGEESGEGSGEESGENESCDESHADTPELSCKNVENCCRSCAWLETPKENCEKCAMPNFGLTNSFPPRPKHIDGAPCQCEACHFNNMDAFFRCFFKTHWKS